MYFCEYFLKWRKFETFFKKFHKNLEKLIMHFMNSIDKEYNMYKLEQGALTERES
jgi:hypothetical protein